MRKKIIKIIYWIYLKLIRKWLSPLIYIIVKKILYNNDDLGDRWKEIREYGKYDFQEELLNYDYRWDYNSGILDFSLQEPNFFFEEREWFRDCDDFARMWYWWAEYRDYDVWEVVVWNGLKSAHMITVYKDEEGYWLCNYRVTGIYESLEGAIESLDKYDGYLVYRSSK